MSKPDNKTSARAAWLRDELNLHNTRYYVDDDPLISDAEYDDLFHELRRLEESHPELQTPDSPTLRVGAPPKAGFETYQHGMPMLSLGNAFSDEDVIDFDRKIRE